uniref:Protein kinase domain-containing protein n=1 Tax=Strongyloides venezuelensis TaxID=75913 RepID=A0A0K0G336_STRVS
MDNVQFSVTFKTQKSKGSDSESTISNESDDESFNIDDSEDEFSISNVKPKNIKPITIKKCICKFKIQTSRILMIHEKFSSLNNTFNRGKNLYKLIKMKQPEYLCMRTLGIKRFRMNKNIIRNAVVVVEYLVVEEIKLCMY